MVVSITWSSAAAGTAPIIDAVYHGIVPGGGSSPTPADLYVSHDGVNSITNAGFYIQQYNGGGYTGTASPATDYTDIIGWGPGFGIATNQVPPGFIAGVDVYHTGGVGLPGTEIQLKTTAGVAVAGIMTPAEEAHILVRASVPMLTPAGRRFIDHCLRFDYTS